jgi:hypothetical protein
MKIGAWIHTHVEEDHPELTLANQVETAAQNGLTTIRSYSLSYAEEAAPALQRAGMSLLAGMHVDSHALVANWRSQIHLDELSRYHELGVPLEGMCVGNELREGGDEPEKKRFTARLSFGLANLIDTYRNWLVQHGLDTPLTYAMEGIVLDEQGSFFEWLWPLVDACDLIGVNLYPMGGDAWFTYGAFDVSRRFLHDARTRHDRLVQFEAQLRRLLRQLAQAGKPLVLTETGFPSAVGYHLQGERLVVPETDRQAYAAAMDEFMTIIARANQEYGGAIRCLYFYEWRDNFYHSKIWNVENSPIHTAFGLCDHTGQPKIDIQRLVALANA